MTQREGCNKKQNGVFVVRYNYSEKNSTRINTTCGGHPMYDSWLLHITGYQSPHSTNPGGAPISIP